MPRKTAVQPEQPTTPPVVPPPTPPPTPAAAADPDLVKQVADLAQTVAEQGAQTNRAIAKLERGLEAFGRVGDSVDRLTGALESNMRFVREQQAIARKRQREAQTQLAAIADRGAPAPTIPTDDPRGVE